MKIICYIALLAVATVWTLAAQTNTNADTNAVNEILALVTTNPPAAKPASRSTTVIEADGPADFDMAGHTVRVIYHDHVRVDSPNLKLRCEWLAADLSQANGRVTNIVAETNVVIDATDDKGQKMHATGDKAVYIFAVNGGVTNETVTLTGDARAEYKKITLTGSLIRWDRTHDTLTVPANPKMVFDQNLGRALTSTNSPILTTNSAVAITNPPEALTNGSAVRTNLPPAVTHQTTLTK